MNDATGMRVMQRFGALVNYLDDVVDAQQVVGFAVGGQGTPAMDVFGNDVVAAVFFAGVVNREDIRVLQHTHHVGFAEKHFASHVGIGVVNPGAAVVYLDRDVSPVIRVMRKVYGAGTSLADFIDDRVFANLFR